MSEALEALGRFGQMLRSPTQFSSSSTYGPYRPEGRQMKGARDEQGRKIREPPKFLQKLGVTGHMDPKFARGSQAMTYTGEIIFTLFASLVIVELLVKNPTVIMGLHGARAIGMFGVLLLSLYNMYRGYAYPEVDIRFYTLELIVTLAINIASIVIASIQISEMRKQPATTTVGQKTPWGEIIVLASSSGLLIFNVFLLGQQWYRYKLGKRETPISGMFTMLMAVFLMGLSVKRLF